MARLHDCSQEVLQWIRNKYERRVYVSHAPEAAPAPPPSAQPNSFDAFGIKSVDPNVISTGCPSVASQGASSADVFSNEFDFFGSSQSNSSTPQDGFGTFVAAAAPSNAVGSFAHPAAPGLPSGAAAFATSFSSIAPHDDFGCFEAATPFEVTPFEAATSAPVWGIAPSAPFEAPPARTSSVDSFSDFVCGAPPALALTGGEALMATTAAPPAAALAAPASEANVSAVDLRLQRSFEEFSMGSKPSEEMKVRAETSRYP